MNKLVIGMSFALLTLVQISWTFPFGNVTVKKEDLTVAKKIQVLEWDEKALAKLTDKKEWNAQTMLIYINTILKANDSTLTNTDIDFLMKNGLFDERYYPGDATLGLFVLDILSRIAKGEVTSYNEFTYERSPSPIIIDIPLSNRNIEYYNERYFLSNEKLIIDGDVYLEQSYKWSHHLQRGLISESINYDVPSYYNYLYTEYRYIQNTQLIEEHYVHQKRNLEVVVSSYIQDMSSNAEKRVIERNTYINEVKRFRVLYSGAEEFKNDPISRLPQFKNLPLKFNIYNKKGLVEEYYNIDFLNEIKKTGINDPQLAYELAKSQLIDWSILVKSESPTFSINDSQLNKALSGLKNLEMESSQSFSYFGFYNTVTKYFLNKYQEVIDTFEPQMSKGKFEPVKSLYVAASYYKMGRSQEAASIYLYLLNEWATACSSFLTLGYTEYLSPDFFKLYAIVSNNLAVISFKEKQPVLTYYLLLTAKMLFNVLIFLYDDADYVSVINRNLNAFLKQNSDTETNLEFMNPYISPFELDFIQSEYQTLYFNDLKKLDTTLITFSYEENKYELNQNEIEGFGYILSVLRRQQPNLALSIVGYSLKKEILHDELIELRTNELFTFLKINGIKPELIKTKKGGILPEQKDVVTGRYGLVALKMDYTMEVVLSMLSFFIDQFNK